MSTADILAKLMQKKQERTKLDSQIFELEQQFYLSLLHEGTRKAVDVEERVEHEPIKRDSHYAVTDPRTIRGPLAHSMADLASPKQLSRLRAAAQEKDLDWERECQSIYHCRTEELSKRAASALIDHFEGLTALAGR